MSVPLIVEGNSYQYPSQGDKANTGWGNQTTNWASAVTSALTKLGLGGTLSPIANAVINIDSTSKGILIPRMTTAQRNAISSPSNSLLIFNTDLKVLQYYDLSVTSWISVGARLPDNVIFSGTLTVNGNITGLGSISATSGINGATGNFTDTTDATNADNAPLKTLGGMAVKKKLFVGTNLGVGGDANITGNTTVDGVIYADDSTTANTPVISFTGDTDTGIGRSGADTLDFITNGNPRFRIESTGQIKAVYESTIGTDYNTQLDNGYLCRAWVNFNGTLSNTTGTYTRSGTTITCTITSHGLTTGQTANLDFTTGGATDGIYVVTVTNANTFTVEDTVSGTITTSNVTMLSRMIRASGNVSSITDNGTGTYTVNFTNPMPDSNYSVLGQCSFSDTGNFGRIFNAPHATAQTTGAVRVSTSVVSSGTLTLENTAFINVGIFR